jgi:hypothetical protein
VRVKSWKGAWWVFINHQGRRKAKRCASKRSAEIARDQIDAKLKLGHIEVLRPAAPLVAPQAYPRLRSALPEWIDRKARAGDIRGSTPKAYRSRLNAWVFPHLLSGGSRARRSAC